MKKLELNPSDILEWKENHWNLYSSTSVPYGKNRTKLLRLYINGNGWFKVTLAGEVMYEGTQLTHAIAAWDSV